MKHNTFEPCKDHENGHFNWCLLCENERKFSVIQAQRVAIKDLSIHVEKLEEELKLKSEIIESQRENINILHAERDLFISEKEMRDPTSNYPDWEKEEKEYFQDW